ncbi:MAG: uroporphyrinogen-III C-methyltransferase [Paracoccaceae bacterium]|nr:uroporphyrinogen-III C-methyltransferase [Paracoccaceae bacterium]
MTGPGRVFLVGAGPGDPELLTLKALRRMAQADAVVYDRLVSPDILDLVPAAAERHPVGKAPRNHPVPQEEINDLMVALAGRGLQVVRLKGGDPFVFGRGGEEMLALKRAGIPYEVVPGISAAQGCAAEVGIPLTHRGIANSVRYITGHCRADLALDLDWAGLANAETTLVVYMGVANIGSISRALIAHGMDREMPVLAVSRATLADERRLRADLGTITGKVRAAQMPGPVLFIIGRVLDLHDPLPAIDLAGISVEAPIEVFHA